MTNAELYEIVKDHRDVWGEHMFPQIHPLHGTIWWANRAMFGMPANTQLVEPALLGLGVAWLVENGHRPSLHKLKDGRCTNWIDYDPNGPMDGGTEIVSKNLLAAVYAAIGEVKKACP